MPASVALFSLLVLPLVASFFYLSRLKTSRSLVQSSDTPASECGKGFLLGVYLNRKHVNWFIINLKKDFRSLILFANVTKGRWYER